MAQSCLVGPLGVTAGNVSEKIVSC